MNGVRVIGLIGEAGSGKSSVRAWLAERGAAELDADRVARGLLEGGETRAAVLEAFGAGLSRDDGGIDRGALARMVFGDPAALAALEAILHPGVRSAMCAWLREEERPVKVVEAIKLVESGMGACMDEIWLVTCARDEQLRRLTERGWTKAEARRRLGSGRPLLELLADCALVIDNSGDWSRTVGQLEAAWRRRVGLDLAAESPDGADPMNRRERRRSKP